MNGQLTVLILLLAGCRSATIEIPPIARSGPESYVRAWNAVDADRVAEAMERLVPSVRAIKQVAKPAPLVILCREGQPLGALGGQTPVFVFLGADSRSREDLVLAHELSHWFGDETWDRLPHALEEGLAEHVASLVVTPVRSSNFQDYLFRMPEHVGTKEFRAACAATFDVHADWDRAEEIRTRVIGFVAATAIGVDGLRRLCERAEREGFEKVPTDWLLDALPFSLEAPQAFIAALRRRLIELDRIGEEDRVRKVMAESFGAVPQSK